MPRTKHTARDSASPEDVPCPEASVTIDLDWVGAKYARQTAAVLMRTNPSYKITHETSVLNKRLREQDELVSQSKRAKMAAMLANLPSDDNADLADDEAPFRQRLAKVAAESDRPEEAAVALQAGLQPVNVALRAPDGSEWTVRQRGQIRSAQRRSVETVLTVGYLALHDHDRTGAQGSSSRSPEAKKEAKQWADLERQNNAWHCEHLGPGEEYNADHVATLIGEQPSLYHPLQMVLDDPRHPLLRAAEERSAKKKAGHRAAAKAWLERNPGLPLPEPPSP